MNINSRITLLGAVVTLGLALACGSDRVTTPAEAPGIASLRTSVEPFSSFALSREAGYTTAITDCMSHGDLGAMGVHFANAALLDATVNPTKPEVLIYEPGTNGAMNLVGVEFVVPFAAVPRSAPAPVLFDQHFTPDDTFGVWALHVWTTRSNPSGLFAPWNPRVHC